jgi:hypothetical protein
LNHPDIVTQCSRFKYHPQLLEEVISSRHCGSPCRAPALLTSLVLCTKKFPVTPRRRPGSRAHACICSTPASAHSTRRLTSSSAAYLLLPPAPGATCPGISECGGCPNCIHAEILRTSDAAGSVASFAETAGQLSYGAVRRPSRHPPPPKRACGNPPPPPPGPGPGHMRHHRANSAGPCIFKKWQL